MSRLRRRSIWRCAATSALKPELSMKVTWVRSTVTLPLAKLDERLGESRSGCHVDFRQTTTRWPPSSAEHTALHVVGHDHLRITQRTDPTVAGCCVSRSGAGAARDRPASGCLAGANMGVVSTATATSSSGTPAAAGAGVSVIVPRAATYRARGCSFGGDHVRGRRRRSSYSRRRAGFERMACASTQRSRRSTSTASGWRRVWMESTCESTVRHVDLCG